MVTQLVSFFQIIKSFRDWFHRLTTSIFGMVPVLRRTLSKSLHPKEDDRRDEEELGIRLVGRHGRFIDSHGSDTGRAWITKSSLSIPAVKRLKAHIDIEGFANVTARVLPRNHVVDQQNWNVRCKALRLVVVGSYFKITLSNILRCWYNSVTSIHSLYFKTIS